MKPAAYDLAVIGGGPGGLAAATTAAELGARVVLVDESPRLGGQIWRSHGTEVAPAARSWLERLQRSGVEVHSGSSVWQATGPGTLETSTGTVRSHRTILACGSRERFLPFPGWTLPGVHGVGGLQALVHSGLKVRGRRVVLAGTGPLLLLVAKNLTSRGAEVVRVAEQAPFGRLALFFLRIGMEKRMQAIGMATRALRSSSWPLEAFGDGRVEGVRLRVGAKTETLACDLLGVGFGLVPNLELARALGCAAATEGIAVDRNQETSVPGVFAVGEVCGVKGAPGAIADGCCAGYAALSSPVPRPITADRDRQRRFQVLLARTFRLRPELRGLWSPETILCRCEGVATGRVAEFTDWTAAKLQTRCGMGICQGRICGAATEVLFGWGPRAVRPPIVPLPIGEVLRIAPNPTSGGDSP